MYASSHDGHCQAMDSFHDDCRANSGMLSVATRGPHTARQGMGPVVAAKGVVLGAEA